MEVRILGLRKADGEVRVAVCREAEFLKAHCARGGAASASTGRVRITDVPPGRYALQAHHDENANGHLDRTALGRPEDGLGFSRDTPMRRGPPRYRDAVVEDPRAGGVLSLTTRYL